MAKIDDTLFNRHRKKEKILKLLINFSGDCCDPEDLENLEYKLNMEDKDTPMILLEIMVEEKDDDLSNLALLLLSETYVPKVTDAVERLFESQDISEDQRSRLAAYMVLSTDGEIPLPESDASPAARLLDFLDTYWKQMDPEDIGHIWMTDFHTLKAKERIPLLHALFETGSPVYLPIFAIEIGSSQVTVSRFVSGRIGDMTNEESLLMLKSLPEIRDTATRLNIENSIKKLLKKKHNGELEPPGKFFSHTFYNAMLAEEDLAGCMSIIFSKLAPDGQIMYLFTLIDRWDRGITHAFGDHSESKDKLQMMIDEFNMDGSEVQYRKISRDYALWLLKKGEELTIERGNSLPADYLLWRRILWNEKSAIKKYPLKFGLKCCECGAFIQPSKKNTSSWIIKDFAICHDCIKKKNKCENCGAKITPQLSYTLAHPKIDHFTVICKKCYDKAGNKLF
jgi:hypothetical protein